MEARLSVLKPVHTVAVRLSPNSATVTVAELGTVAVVSPFSATVALFCDGVDRALLCFESGTKSIVYRYYIRSVLHVNRQ